MMMYIVVNFSVSVTTLPKPHLPSFYGAASILQMVKRLHVRAGQGVFKRSYPPYDRSGPTANTISEELLKPLLPIESIAAKLNLPEDLYEKRSTVSAKLSLDLLNAWPNGEGKLGKL